ncbi:hypothetical protein SCHPADRAFT_472994 [Schizopora paradoxa]|uniref:Uncharacterized protein n=1 Tax=Schizopora paradoxa TaxID=27342 RepID=A0A0H2S3B7_9AGAM|nr:hypothetical protein SCHPADRAFT_472994 [Schizopora paradoxa]
MFFRYSDGYKLFHGLVFLCFVHHVDLELSTAQRSFLPTSWIYSAAIAQFLRLARLPEPERLSSNGSLNANFKKAFPCIRNLRVHPLRACRPRCGDNFTPFSLLALRDGSHAGFGAHIVRLTSRHQVVVVVAHKRDYQQDRQHCRQRLQLLDSSRGRGHSNVIAKVFQSSGKSEKVTGVQ